jgi:hypothetical protein
MNQITIAQISFSIHDPIVCIGHIQYDSLKRNQIQSTNVRKSIQTGYCINENDSLNLSYIKNITYNKKGFIVCITSREFPSNKYDSSIISYDSFNRFKESIHYDSLGSILIKSTWIFDSTGRKLYYLSWSKDSPEKQSIKTSEYDSHGNCIRDSSDGTIWESEFDNQFKLLKQRRIGGIDTSYALTYYSSDSLQDTTVWYSHGKIDDRKISRRDKANRIIENIYEDFLRGYVSIQQNIYSDSGMIEKGSIIGSSGRERNSWFREYTSTGDLIEEIHYDESNNITLKITNTFDHNGNIILYDFLQITENNHRSHRIIKWYYEYY